jgi:enoyl-CoA hydratase/carnithine racemase
VLARRSGRIGYLTLNRPSALNAITIELAQELERGLVELADDVNAIIVRGAGGNFSVGGDLEEVERLRDRSPDAMAELFESFARTTALIAELPVAVVAAVEGYALAGGFELIQACDFALASDDAQIGDHHANFGMVPGGGSSQRLPRLIGRHRALALLLTGDRLSGAEAAAWGLVYRSVRPTDFEAAIDELAATLAAKRRDVIGHMKALVRAGLEQPLEAGLTREREVVLAHLLAPGALEEFASLRSER